jgi:hypothetical protein
MRSLDERNGPVALGIEVPPGVLFIVDDVIE